MDNLQYVTWQCKHCKVKESGKGRPGSKRIRAMDDFTVQAFESFSFGTTEDDKARPIATIDEVQGYYPNGDAEKHLVNYHICYRERYNSSTMQYEWKRVTPEPVILRMTPGQDAVIKITIYDHPTAKNDDQRSTVKHFLENIRKLTDEQAAQIACYLGGGHKWEVVESRDYV